MNIETKNLIEITGSYVNYSIALKPKLLAIKKYFPENVILGRYDRIGGIIEDTNAKCKHLLPFNQHDCYIYILNILF